LAKEEDRGDRQQGGNPMLRTSKPSLLSGYAADRQ
jgi:hypothetical protein